jgi:hypothetical protein
VAPEVIPQGAVSAIHPVFAAAAARETGAFRAERRAALVPSGDRPGAPASSVARLGEGLQLQRYLIVTTTLALAVRPRLSLSLMASVLLPATGLAQLRLRPAAEALKPMPEGAPLTLSE